MNFGRTLLGVVATLALVACESRSPKAVTVQPSNSGPRPSQTGEGMGSGDVNGMGGGIGSGEPFTQGGDGMLSGAPGSINGPIGGIGGGSFSPGGIGGLSGPWDGRSDRSSRVWSIQDAAP